MTNKLCSVCLDNECYLWKVETEWLCATCLDRWHTELLEEGKESGLGSYR